jgi:hypothetical protein
MTDIFSETNNKPRSEILNILAFFVVGHTIDQTFLQISTSQEHLSGML